MLAAATARFRYCPENRQTVGYGRSNEQNRRSCLWPDSNPLISRWHHDLHELHVG